MRPTTEKKPCAQNQIYEHTESPGLPCDGRTAALNQSGLELPLWTLRAQIRQAIRSFLQLLCLHQQYFGPILKRGVICDSNRGITTWLTTMHSLESGTNVICCKALPLARPASEMPYTKTQRQVRVRKYWCHWALHPVKPPVSHASARSRS
jgi:hypothetical protein